MSISCFTLSVNKPRRRVTFGAATLVAALAASAGVALTGTGASALTAPSGDSFYSAPANIASYAPGALIRSRAVSLTALGISLPIKSWQIAYRTNDNNGDAEIGISTVIVPAAAYSQGARPLVSYQFAEDSVGSQCAPSYSLRTLSNAEISVEAALLAPILLKGWAITIPDYEGPNSEWIVGKQAGQTTLDGVRATRTFSTAGISTANQIALMGYSGGAQATGWAAELQPSYAPELTLSGVSVGGIPADLYATFQKLNGSLYAGFLAAAIIGLNRAYPQMDIQNQANAVGKQTLQKVQDDCILDILTVGPFKKLDDYTVTPDLIDQPLYRNILNANQLGQSKPAEPIYDYHAIPDEIVPVGQDDTLVNAYCAMGVPVVKVRILIGEHISTAATGAGGALQFISDRFAGKPVKSTC